MRVVTTPMHGVATSIATLVALMWLVSCETANAFLVARHSRHCLNRHSYYGHEHDETQPRTRATEMTSMRMALGDYVVEVPKPLGMVLEERAPGQAPRGVKVKELFPNGHASKTGLIVPGDVLLRVGDQDVTNADFDTVMGMLVTPTDTVRLSLGDGLGQLDMPKNVVKLLRSTEDAYLVDAVVREAVREIRRSGKMGSLLRVEVVVGAGVRRGNDDAPTRAQTRFFAILSTDGEVSSYSCNVAATGVQWQDGTIQIVALSCAKDEGLGQTFELIVENDK